MDVSSVLVHLPSQAFQLPKERNYSPGTVAGVIEASILTSECVTHTSDFSLASCILITLYHMQTNSCCLLSPD